MGVFSPDDPHMSKIGDLVAGKLMSGWYDSSDAAGPKTRPRTAFTEPVPSCEVLTVAGESCKTLYLLLQILKLLLWVLFDHYASGFCINKFAYLLPTQTSQFLKGFQTWWRTSTSLQATWLPYGTWRMRSGMIKHWSRLWLGTRVNPTMILFSLWGPLLQAVPLLRQNGGPLLQTTQVSVWSWQLLRVWMTSLPLQRFLFDIK